jgi:trigger factor
MKSEAVELSPTRKEITIEIDPKIIREAYDRISDNYAKQAKVPGFRPGHAPRSVVRSRFKSEIRAAALQELVPDAVNEAIVQHAPTAIGEPDVHLDNNEALEKFGDEPISVKVNVEVLPQIELQDYRGLEVIRKTRPIADEDVDQMLEALRDSSASMQPVEDRGAQKDDTVSINVDGIFVDEPEAEHIKADDVEVTLGAEGVQPEFNENLMGVKADDEKTFIVNYPEDFNAKGLAGKKVEYTAKVTAVRVKELPEADDDWAKSLGEDFESLTGLREKIRADLERRAGQESDHRVRAEVMRKLIESHQFEVPESLVAHQTNVRLESVMRDMMGRGIDPRHQEINWEGARDEMRGQAEEDVRGSILLERIAEAEKIDVSPEEIESEIQVIARGSQQAPEQVRSVLTKDGGERSIANRLRNRKALDLLVENAKVTEGNWKEEVQESDVRSQNSE